MRPVFTSELHEIPEDFKHIYSYEIDWVNNFWFVLVEE